MVESLPGKQTVGESVSLKSSFIVGEQVRLHYLAWDPTQTSRGAIHSAQVQDDDELPLVMLHSLGTTADSWRLVAAHLGQRHPVIAFDLRGHGQSDKPDDGYDLGTVAEDVVQGMAAIGLGQVALVGHGWGAKVALMLAVLHPALVSHLVLVDCPFVEPRHWPGMTRERFVRETVPQEMYSSRATFLEAMQQEMANFWSPEVEEIALATVQEQPDGTLKALLQPENQRLIRTSLWEDRALAYYGKITCPVLLVPAAAQPQPGGLPPEKLERQEEFAIAKGYMAAQVARMIHHCTVLWMPDTAHDIQLQRPRHLAAAIASFVREQA
ncbi:MAG: alpha/beta fold hydrolase [Ktedonobacteraceae bacterium]